MEELLGRPFNLYFIVQIKNENKWSQCLLEIESDIAAKIGWKPSR